MIHKVRKTLAATAVLAVLFAGGIVAAPQAGAQPWNTDCNQYWNAGNGYYGCDGINSAWNHGVWSSYTYYW